MPSKHRPIQFRLPWLRQSEQGKADKIAQAILNHSREAIEEGKCPICQKAFDNCQYFETNTSKPLRKQREQMLYNIELISHPEFNLLTVGFGEPAQNDEIVREVAESLKSVRSQAHGKLLKVSGAASLPVAMVLCHGFAHLVTAIAVFDPKIQKYVVVVSHDPAFNLGDLVE